MEGKGPSEALKRSLTDGLEVALIFFNMYQRTEDIFGIQPDMYRPKPGTREAAVAFTSGPACLSRPDCQEKA